MKTFSDEDNGLTVEDASQNNPTSGKRGTVVGLQRGWWLVRFEGISQPIFCEKGGDVFVVKN